MNDRPARPAEPVRAGDRIRLTAGRRRRTYEILALPARGVSRAAAPGYYTLISDDDVVLT